MTPGGAARRSPHARSPPARTPSRSAPDRAAAASAAAAGMASDTMDAGGNRTVVTADAQRQNEAAAYKIVKTTAYTSAWSAWTDYY